MEENYNLDNTTSTLTNYWGENGKFPKLMPIFLKRRGQGVTQDYYKHLINIISDNLLIGIEVTFMTTDKDKTNKEIRQYLKEYNMNILEGIKEDDTTFWISCKRKGTINEVIWTKIRLL